MTESMSPLEKAKVMLLDASHSIAYVEAGRGAPVMFIHGSLCDYRYWNPQLVGMSDRFRIITPSLSRYYPRLPSSSGESFSWVTHVRQVTDFLRRLGPAPIHLIGHSRGACIAYQAALQNTQLVASLTLVDPAGPNELDALTVGADSKDMLDIKTRAVALIAAGSIDEGLKLFVDATSRPGFWERSKSVFQGMARDNAGTLASQVSDPLPTYREREARTLDRPCFIVDGARSPAAYRNNAAALGQWIPNALRLTMAGASHGLTWSHATTFNHALRGFLANHAR